MKVRIDQEAANGVILSLGVMITIGRQPGRVPNPRPVMFTVAPAGEEDGFEQASLDEGMDIVCLTFEPGRERDGPVNAAVYEQREGRLTTWPECSPWSYSEGGPHLLVASGTDVGFFYDGVSLVIVRNVPQDDAVRRRRVARRLLRLMIRRTPAGILTRRIR